MDKNDQRDQLKLKMNQTQQGSPKLLEQIFSLNKLMYSKAQEAINSETSKQLQAKIKEGIQTFKSPEMTKKRQEYYQSVKERVKTAADAGYTWVKTSQTSQNFQVKIQEGWTNIRSPQTAKKLMNLFETYKKRVVSIANDGYTWVTASEASKSYQEQIKGQFHALYSSQSLAKTNDSLKDMISGGYTWALSHNLYETKESEVNKNHYDFVNKTKKFTEQCLLKIAVAAINGYTRVKTEEGPAEKIVTRKAFLNDLDSEVERLEKRLARLQRIREQLRKQL